MEKQKDKRKELLALQGKVEWEGNLDEMRTDVRSKRILRSVQRNKE
jgi:hypothetical protein